MAIIVKEDDVEDVNDDDISMEANKQGFIEELNPLKTRLNYNNGSPH
jgi:hypothetical protein